MKTWKKEAIKEIMEGFDFAKVKGTMAFLKWKWQDNTETPSIAELKETASYLLNKAVKRKDFRLETGGFIVIHEPKNGYLELIFSLDNWRYDLRSTEVKLSFKGE